MDALLYFYLELGNYQKNPIQNINISQDANLYLLVFSSYEIIFVLRKIYERFQVKASSDLKDVYFEIRKFLHY